MFSNKGPMEKWLAGLTSFKIHTLAIFFKKKFHQKETKNESWPVQVLVSVLPE